MKYTIYQVDAFTGTLFAGNPAAVVPLQQWLGDAEMQAIAAENNLAETAFVCPQQDSYAIRWFTPAREVDLCGHATLASAFVYYQCLGYNEPHIVFDSRSGPLRVARDADWYTMDFPQLTGDPVEVPESARRLFKGDIVEYRKGEFSLLVFANLDSVIQAAPDFCRLEQDFPEMLIITAQAQDYDFICRVFAPAFGIDEDAATGSAYCMLTPYWASRLNKSQLTARQCSRRGADVRTGMQGDRVLISGQAVLYMQGEIQL